MTSNYQWIKAEVQITETADGSRIFQNKIPLASHPANIGTWLHANAEKYPDKHFLLEKNISGDWQGITYAQGLHLTNQLSNGLVKRIPDLSRPIAVLSENSINMALIQLAAMQVGLPVVPISYAYSVRSETGSLIKHILDVTQSAILVMSDADIHMPKLNQWEKGDLQLFAFQNSNSHEDVLPLEDLLVGGNTLSSEAQSCFDAVTPDTLAKIQFTSGSTNLPKGVEVTHGMQISNQTGIAQMWPFLDGNDVVLDWLPWNHTFGGNFVFNMVLMHGGTFYIDHGNPTPQGIAATLQNIKEVSPTLYFSVPRGYTALYAAMKQDNALKEAFFKNLKFIFTAAAALDQATFENLNAMSAEVRGTPIPFFSGWGSTETAPDSTLVFWPAKEAKVIGLPIPGVAVKLVNDRSGKAEIRVKGPNITPGYYKNEAATKKSFDPEGYFLTGDAGKLLEPANPSSGLIFDGRIGEDFKLNSGVWVNNANIRNSINELGQPFLLEVVLAAPNKAYLSALVFPNIPALRNLFAKAVNKHPEDKTFLKTPQVIDLFRGIFIKHNAKGFGSSGRIERFCILTTPPRLDKNETTDKGYINQIAVLTHRADRVEQLYQTELPSDAYAVIAE